MLTLIKYLINFINSVQHINSDIANVLKLPSNLPFNKTLNFGHDSYQGNY